MCFEKQLEKLRGWLRFLYLSMLHVELQMVG